MGRSCGAGVKVLTKMVLALAVEHPSTFKRECDRSLLVRKVRVYIEHIQRGLLRFLADRELCAYGRVLLHEIPPLLLCRDRLGLPFLTVESISAYLSPFG